MAQVIFLEIPVQGQRVSFILENGQRGISSPVSSVNMLADGGYSVVTSSGSIYAGKCALNDQTIAFPTPLGYPPPPYTQPTYQPSPQPLLPIAGGRQRFIAILLAVLIGGLGVHKFYLGEMTSGVLYLVFFWTAIPSILSIIDIINYACMDDHTFNLRYNPPQPSGRTS